MNLVLDIGNSRTKLAVFENDKIAEYQVLSEINAKTLEAFISRYTSINQCIISAVKEINSQAKNLLKKQSIKTQILDHRTKLPFENTYTTPQTLGKDRIAAVAGACSLYPHKNVLIIDAGTAITYDLIDSDNKYLGGNISPGLNMRFKSLNSFTANLPLLNKKDETGLVGSNTNEAIRTGVQNGMIFEIEGYLTKIGNKYPQLIVLLTGGDASFFENKLKNPIFAVSELTLIGLNFILKYNV
jgi:type III pantothenate kinase